MGDYEGSTTIDVPRDELFELLSRLDILPKYMSRLTEVHSLGGDQVSVEAKVQPGDVGWQQGEERTVHGEGVFRIDADGRRLYWSSEGPNDYHGELSVSEAGTGSRVVVRLHTLHDDVEGIEQGIADTLENIERLASASS